MPNAKALISVVPLLALAAPAQAADVTLRGSLISSCILTLSTEGRLARIERSDHRRLGGIGRQCRADGRGRDRRDADRHLLGTER